MVCLASAWAHKLGQSYVYLSIFDQRIEGRVEMPLPELSEVLGLDLPNKETTPELLEPHRAQILEYVTSRLSMQLEGDTEPADLVFKEPTLFATSAQQYVIYEFVWSGLSRRPEKIEIEYRGFYDQIPAHVGMVIIEQDWRTATVNNESKFSLIFKPGAERQVLDVNAKGNHLGFVGVGMDHIFIGTDHILFLVALLLPAVMVCRERKWEPVESFKQAGWQTLKIVTVFTIAHSITLCLATLRFFEPSSRWVETIIALSIAVTAFDILVPLFKDRIWVVVFCFGLFHGFGFASILSGLEIPSSHILWSLLGFNVGVELGQIVIVALLFPVLYFLRKTTFYARFLMPVGAAILIFISLYWAIERGLEVDLPLGRILGSLFGL